MFRPYYIQPYKPISYKKDNNNNKDNNKEK